MSASDTQATSMAGGVDVRLLPARHGDCVLLQWPEGGRTRRMLVDAGPAHAYAGITQALRGLDDPAIDVLVVTHVDADHIEGVVKLVNDRALGLDIGEVWFNGGPQVAPPPPPPTPDDEGYLSAVQGEILGSLISSLALPWNESFAGQAIWAGEEQERLPSFCLPGGLRVTVMAPDRPALTRLATEWRSVCEKANLTVGSVSEALRLFEQRRNLQPGDGYLDDEVPNVDAMLLKAYDADRKPANASSIVLLVEREGICCLLTGDSTPGVLLPAVQRLLAERNLEQLPLTHFKLPHHGSAANITAELLQLLPAERYLFSTDGSFFKHPDDKAVALVLNLMPRGAELVFNYGTPRNRRWAKPALIGKFHHRVSFADPNDPGDQEADSSA